MKRKFAKAKDPLGNIIDLQNHSVQTTTMQFDFNAICVDWIVTYVRLDWPKWQLPTNTR